MSLAVPDLPGCFGPYLRYAIATNFHNFEPLDADASRLLLLVEFKDLERKAKFVTRMKGHGDVEMGPTHRRARHVPVRADRAAVGSGTFDIWIDLVSSVELSLPLMPTILSRSITINTPDPRYQLDGEPDAEVLVGLIDDGCPFAAAQFLNRPPGAALSTRVRAIWDQNQPRDLIHITDPNGQQHTFGKGLTDFNYGAEFWRGSRTSGTTSLIGLNDWIGLHLTEEGGSIDEDGCYADAEFTTLKRQASHGAAVMDILAGSVPPSSRVGPPPDYRDPPHFADRPSNDKACHTDLVFVQFPEEGIRDATGVWLKGYVVDAINYILSFAHPQNTKRVIVNLSYGPTTGPHNGTIELEEALRELVQIYDGHPLPRLEIFLPAGNAYLSEGHVAYHREASEPADYVSWTWRIPPDNTVLCFAEVWVKTSDLLSTANVTLTSPAGIIFSPTTGPTPPSPGMPFPPFTGVSKPLVWGNDTMWLLAVEPTIATSHLAPEHGDWTIRTDGLKPGARLHAYVARSDPNMDAHTGARRSYFVDAGWESRSGAAAGCTYVDGKFAKAGSLIHRHGTLNGIATDYVPSIHVAGGFMLANGRKSPYASAGPSRGTRVGPDYAMFCDQSYALQGVRAGGNRSGVAFRLIGTSTAAPQLARWVARPPASFPNASNPGEPEALGAGDIQPP
jgi:hypothetical protein